MTVPATTRRAGPFNGNGVATSFPFTFKVFTTADLALTKTSDTGITSALVLGSDYSVTLNPDQDAAPGGSITYPLSGSPLATGESLVAVGALPYDQTTSFPAGGSYRASTHENAFDRTVLQIQQLAEEVGRSLTLPPGAASADTTLPAPLANNVIGWDDSAQALVNYSPGDLATVVATGTSYTNVFNGTGAQTQFTLTANPGSVNALDIAIGGVSQTNGVDFTVSGTTLTFTSAPPAGTGNIAVRYVAAVPIGTANAQDVTFLQAGTGATSRTAQSRLRDTVSVKDFGAVGDGVTDDTAAIQAALTAAAGRVVHVPAGTYVVTATLSYNTTATFGAFAPGVKIVGDGIAKTFFDNRVANAPMIDIDSAVHGGSYTASMGSLLQRFTIINTTSPANSVGIRVLNGYEVVIDHLYIKGMTAHGIELKNGLYIDDGWNMVSITNTWIDACLGWGIKADGSAARNEGSYTYLRTVFFQSCGTASGAATPPSGGMIWKGQILKMESCAFANGVQNVGLFIKGESGLGQTVDLSNTTFENCVKRSLYATGVLVFRGRNLQFYNNNDYVGTVACEFDGSAFTVRQVDIESVTVRATSGNNPYTAFKISGANAELRTCRVRGVNWENFDYTGQTRFDGWQFDPVPIACDVVALNATTVLVRPNQTKPNGNTMPLRLRGGGGGVPSTTGEWTARQIPNTGLSISNGGLANTTRYYVYLYDNNGAPALELSTTAFTIDTATGYPVKTGDTARTYCGSVITDGSAQFVTSGTGWLNPALVPGSQTGVYTFLWTDSTNRLRVRYATAPTSDTDGTVVGTQT